MFRHVSLRKEGVRAAEFSSFPDTGIRQPRRCPLRRPFDSDRARTRPARAVAEARPVEIRSAVTVAFPCSGPWRSWKNRGCPGRCEPVCLSGPDGMTGPYGGSGPAFMAVRDRGRTPGRKGAGAGFDRRRPDGRYAPCRTVRCSSRSIRPAGESALCCRPNEGEVFGILTKKITFVLFTTDYETKTSIYESLVLAGLLCRSPSLCSCGPRVARVNRSISAPRPVTVEASDGAFDLTRSTKICLLSDDTMLLRSADFFNGLR